MDLIRSVGKTAEEPLTSALERVITPSFEEFYHIKIMEFLLYPIDTIQNPYCSILTDFVHFRYLSFDNKQQAYPNPIVPNMTISKF